MRYSHFKRMKNAVFAFSGDEECDILVLGTGHQRAVEVFFVRCMSGPPDHDMGKMQSR